MAACCALSERSLQTPARCTQNRCAITASRSAHAVVEDPTVARSHQQTRLPTSAMSRSGKRSGKFFGQSGPTLTAPRSRVSAHRFVALALLTAVGCVKQRASERTGGRSGAARAVQQPAASSAVTNATAQFPAPWPGPSGPFAFFEGENFVVDGE